MEIQIGQVVRVVKQSRTINKYVNMVGLVGYVKELQECDGEKLVYFHELKLDDGGAGLGSVPVSCIKPVDPVADVEWLRAKERHDEHIGRLLREAEERTERHAELRRRAAELAAGRIDPAGMSSERVLEIVDAYERSRDELSEEMGVEADW